MKGKVFVGAAAVAALIVVALVLPLPPSATKPSSSTLSLRQAGLESYYPDNSTDVQLTSLSGATGTGNASFTAFDASEYLHIGVKAPENGSWTGYYQVTSDTYATLVHAVLLAPSANLSSSYFTNGIYIQAANQALNYLTCVSVTNATGTYWMVVHGYKEGNMGTNPTVYDAIWQDPTAHQPLGRDCVLVTNGQDDLQVYLDHQLVYQSQHLSLGMQEPFNFFVGVESEYAHQLVYGSTRDFYVTNGDDVNVTGLPSKATVAEVVGADGGVLASAPVREGTAAIDLGAYSFPVVGYVKVFASSGPTTNSTLVASTQGEVSIFGGDVFSLGSSQSTTSQLSISSVDTNGDQLDGYYTTVTKEGVQVAAGYLPMTFSLQNGQTYTIMVSNYGGYVFDQWSDGPTSSVRTITISSNINLVAVFREADSSPPNGHSVIDVSAVNSSGTALTGIYTTLWENGFIVAQGYSPASFVVDDNASYQVSMSSYGSYAFTGWQDGTNGNLDTVTSGSGTVSSVVATYS